MEYIIYREEKIREKRDDLIDFLKKIDAERNTLFTKLLSEDEYCETISLLIDKSIVIVTALLDSKIIGLAGLNCVNKRGLEKVLPYVRGYVVVKSGFQGRGIGYKLSLIRNQVMEKIPIFHLSIIFKNNFRMIRIVEKMSYIRFYQNDLYVFHFKAFNILLSPFSFLFYPIFKLTFRRRFP